MPHTESGASAKSVSTGSNARSGFRRRLSPPPRNSPRSHPTFFPSTAVNARSREPTSAPSPSIASQAPSDARLPATAKRAGPVWRALWTETNASRTNRASKQTASIATIYLEITPAYVKTVSKGKIARAKDRDDSGSSHPPDGYCLFWSSFNVFSSPSLYLFFVFTWLNLLALQLKTEVTFLKSKRKIRNGVKKSTRIAFCGFAFFGVKVFEKGFDDVKKLRRAFICLSLSYLWMTIYTFVTFSNGTKYEIRSNLLVQ